MPEFLTRGERRHIESLDRVGVDLVVGQVRVDDGTCRGCGLCAAACPSSVLEVVEKKSRMAPGAPMCFSCGCCAAICPEGAIELTEFLQFRRGFRYLDRGAPEPPRRF